jgi:hypothetical protein
MPQTRGSELDKRDGPITTGVTVGIERCPRRDHLVSDRPASAGGAGGAAARGVGAVGVRIASRRAEVLVEVVSPPRLSSTVRAGAGQPLDPRGPMRSGVVPAG